MCQYIFADSGNVVACVDDNSYQGRKRFCNPWPCGVVIMDSGQIVIADGSIGGSILQLQCMHHGATFRSDEAIKHRTLCMHV